MQTSVSRRLTRYVVWGILALLIIWILSPTWISLGNKVAVSYALDNARTVRLEHYQIGWRELGHPETVLSTKDLAPDDFHKVSDAFVFI
jgi:hypothetical protein